MIQLDSLPDFTPTHLKKKIEAASKQVPTMLYHYTDGGAVLGMIKNKELWATSVQYMNDPNELHFVINTVINYCETKILELPQPLQVNLFELAENQNLYSNLDIQNSVTTYVLKEIIQYLEVRSKTHEQICLISLSSAKDLLSQWRAYASSGGYSIGFNSAKLQKLLKQGTTNYELLPCIYKKREHQEQYAKQTIDYAIKHLVENIQKFLTYDRVNPKTKLDNGFAYMVADNIIRLSSILKDASFREEKEWRLVSGPVSDSHLSYRNRGPVIVPYATFKLAEELPTSNSQGEKVWKPISVIQKVLIGPGSEREKRLSAQTLASFFRKHEVSIDERAITITNTTFSKNL
ncbi:MAG: DUF2971 domain-containing protein [Trueperaceae bacterium]